MPNPLDSPTSSEQWATLQATSGVLSYTNVATLAITYYHQFSDLLSYNVNDGGAPTAPTFTANQFGVATGQVLTTIATNYWFDAGSSWSATNPLGGSTSTERWQVQTASGTLASSAVTTIALQYYHQYLMSAKYTTSDATTPSASVILSGSQFGNTGFTLTLTTTLQGVWMDATTAWSVNNPITSGTQRWIAATGYSGTIAASGTISPMYYHQYQLTLEYTIANTPAGSPTVTNIVSYTTLGVVTAATPDMTGSTQVWADAGSAVLYASPLGSSTERWIVTSVDSGQYTAVASVTSAVVVNPVYYHQFMITFRYTDSDNTAITAGAQIGFYTQFGSTTGNNILSSGTYTTYGTTTPASAWVDAGTNVVTFQGYNTGSGQRWDFSWTPFDSSHNILSAGPVTESSYYHQFHLTLEYNIANNPPGSPVVSNIVTYMTFGGSATATPAMIGTTLVWADATTAVTYASPIVSGTERWMVTSADSGTYTAVPSVSAASIVNPTYYHQYQVTATYSTSDSSTPSSSVVLSSYQFGGAYTLTLTTATQNPWLDAGSAWSVNNPITASSTEQWIATSGTFGTVGSSTAVAPLYYHQYKVGMAYSTSDGSTPSAAVVLSGTQSGNAAFTVTLTTSTQNIWLDATTSWSVNNPIAASSTEQWIATSGTSGTVSSSTAVAPLYYHQYKVSMVYSTSDGTTPSAAVILSGTQSGNSAFTVTLTTTAQNVWLDATTSWSVNNPITASSTEQWIATSGTSGTVSSSTVVSPLYYHQYNVSMSYSTSDSSTPSSAVVLSGTQSGNTAFTVTLTTTTQNIWLDATTAWSVNNPITASSTEQWIATSGTSGTVSSSTAVAPLYYHQYEVAMSYSTSDATTPSAAVVLSGTQSGNSAFTVTLTTTTQNVWLDATTAWSVNNPITASSTEQWIATSGTSGTVSSSTAVAPLYYHQYEVAMSYSTSDATTPSAAVVLSGTQSGNSAFTVTLTTTTQNVWLDATTAWSVNNPITASSTEQWIATSGTSGTVSSSTAVAPLYYHQYKVAAHYSTSDGSTPSASVVLSGTQLGDEEFTQALTTSTQNIWLDATTSWSINNPITASSTQQWIATSGTSGTVSSSTAIAPLYYHQYKVSMVYSTSDGTTPSSAVVLSGTQSGNSEFIVTLSTEAQNVWLDATTSWSVNNPITSGTQRWDASSGTSGTVSSEVTISPMYYHQYQLTLEYNIANTPAGSPTVTNIVSYTTFGGAATATPTLAPTATTTVWADANSAVRYASPIVSGTERWMVTSADSGTFTAVSSVSAAATVNPAYYNQFQLTLQYSIANTPAGSPTVTNIVSYTAFGTAGQTATPTLAPTATTTVWADAGSAVKYNSPIVSGSERWMITSADGGQYTAVSSVTSNSTVRPAYYNQYQITLEYNIVNTPAGSPTVTNIASYTSFGTAGLTATPTLAPTATTKAWIDAGSAVKYNSPIVISSERWIVTSADSGQYTALASVTVNVTVNPSYYHQFQMTANYTTSDGSTPTSSIILTGTQLGSSAFSLTLTTASQSVWLDAGSTWNVNGTITSGTQQWVPSNSITGTISAAAALTPAYAHQFQVTFNTNPGAGGSTSPTGTQWVTAGSISITSSPITGYYFTSWTSSGNTIASPNSPYTSATINQAGTITANFALYTYTITVIQGDNGAISPGTSTVDYGSSKTFTMTPKSGYYITDVKVDDVSVGAPASYTVTFITGNHKITASYAPISPTGITTVQATLTSTGATYSIQVVGNATISDMTITPYEGNSTTAVRFTITGASGSSGFFNITLPKSIIPIGTEPTVYIDGATATAQGFTQDGTNYYVWFTAHFSTHQIEIVFATPIVVVTPTPTSTTPPASVSLVVYVVVSVAAIAIVLIVTIGVIARRRQKKNQ